MKFVCDRCLTKYSIADEKVRGRILKIRCKSCSNIITVKESAPAPISVTDNDSERTMINSGPVIVGPAAMVRPAVAPAARAKEPGRPRRPPTPPAPLPASDEVQWFLALEGVQKGPFGRKILVDKLLALPRGADVHVWNDTLDGWKSPGDVPVVARDLQARQRHSPSPPPPPGPRLRPVPPAPGHSGAHSPAGGRHLPAPHAVPAGPPHGSGLHGHVGGAHAAPIAAHAHGHAHGHAPSHHSAPSHSSVGLGLASAQAAAAAVDSSAMLDTPAPIRELVQAHKANGEARLSGAYATAAVAEPHGTNGESDALQALNLGQSWRQSGAPLVAATGSLTAAAMASAGIARGRQKTVKLATGLVAVAAIVIAVIFIAIKRPQTSASANTKVTAGGESALAGKGSEAAKEIKVSPPTTDPAQAVGEGDPTAGNSKPETVARISSGKKPMRPVAPRNPPARGAGALVTAPGSFSPEQRLEASRFADNSRSPLQVRPVAPTAAKVTPNNSDILRVVNANKAGIKICYQRALLRDSTLTSGKIEVEVSIGISGRVKNVTIQGPATFRALDPCIKDLLSRWVFPASSDEYGTSFSYLFQGNQ
ncbi:MAG TPA: AgmX/PglI C-terminal domain-containing protein [Polyangia bacterium]|nr:AgmX/PglI C-terminal domain-containing protein [Polyangia bacterium]